MLFNKTWVHTIKFFWTIVGILQIMFNVKSIMQHLFPFSSIRVTKIVPCFNSHEVWIKKTVWPPVHNKSLLRKVLCSFYSIWRTKNQNSSIHWWKHILKMWKKLLNWYLPPTYKYSIQDSNSSSPISQFINFLQASVSLMYCTQFAHHSRSF